LAKANHQASFGRADFVGSPADGAAAVVHSPLSHRLPSNLPQRMRLRAKMPYIPSSTQRTTGHRVGATSQPNPTA
jgi:hypothetical protein